LDNIIDLISVPIRKICDPGKRWVQFPPSLGKYLFIMPFWGIMTVIEYMKSDAPEILVYNLIADCNGRRKGLLSSWSTGAKENRYA
jgi:hypothetical protein